jgi:magnesium-transporting ATPase (P-type)
VVIVIGVIASLVNILRDSRENYVDALAMFIALILAGRLAVMAARRRARAQMAGLDGVLPSTALRVISDKTQRVACDQLRTGDVIMLARGEVIPCDGTALTVLSVDAAVLNGESRPQLLTINSAVYAGTTCLTNDARLSVTSTGGATRIGGLIREANRAGDRPARLVADVGGDCGNCGLRIGRLVVNGAAEFRRQSSHRGYFSQLSMCAWFGHAIGISDGQQSRSGAWYYFAGPNSTGMVRTPRRYPPRGVR